MGARSLLVRGDVGASGAARGGEWRAPELAGAERIACTSGGRAASRSEERVLQRARASALEARRCSRKTVQNECQVACSS